MFGLGIRHVGQQNAIDLSEAFEGLDNLQHATLDELLTVEGIGDVVAESILCWFADDYSRSKEHFSRHIFCMFCASVLRRFRGTKVAVECPRDIQVLQHEHPGQTN